MSRAGRDKNHQAVAKPHYKQTKEPTMARLPASSATNGGKYPTINFIADHAKLALYVSAMALALGFSQKSSPIGIWIGIAVGCVSVALFSRELATKWSYSKLRCTVIGITLVTLTALFGLWLSEPNLLSVIFKNPSQISWFRQFIVRRTMTHFAVYLGEIGFDVPRITPPIGTGEYSESTLTNSGSGTITLNKSDISDKHEVVWGYSGEIFEHMLFGDLRPMRQELDGTISLKPEVLRRQFMADLYHAYFSCSYFDHVWISHPIKNMNWFSALWEMRSTFGKWQTDHALMYATAYVTENVTNEKMTIDTAVGEIIRSGFVDMSDDYVADLRTIDHIITNHGINLEIPEVVHKKYPLK
jgi:hypothetical protein